MRNKILLISLMVLPFIASCNNNGGGGDEPDYTSPLKFTSLTETATIHPYILERGDNTLPYNLEYSYDAKNWNEVSFSPFGDAHVAEFSLKKDQSIYFRGDNPNGIIKYEDGSNDDLISSLGFLGTVVGSNKNDTTHTSVSGNIMSILYKEDFDKKTDIPTDWALSSLFAMNSSLYDASNLLLPATSLKPNCYNELFGECSLLVSAPKLTASTLVDNCYSSMFYECEQLKITTDPTGNSEIFTCTNVKACNDIFRDTKDWPDDKQVEQGTTCYYVPQE